MASAVSTGSRLDVGGESRQFGYGDLGPGRTKIEFVRLADTDEVPDERDELKARTNRARMRRDSMDIDLTALRSLEAEKDISMDLAIKAIEDALLVAYHHSDGAATLGEGRSQPAETGHVTVWAKETDAKTVEGQ